MSEPPRGVPGLHVERSALAWQRTALALVVAVLTLSRLVAEREPWLGVVLAAVALPLGGWLVRISDASGGPGSGRPGADGRRPGVAAALVVVVGLFELLHLLTG